MPYNHANVYRFEETSISSYWAVKRISVFLYFSLVYQRHTSRITVYNHTVTNIENTLRPAKCFRYWSLCIAAIAGYSRYSSGLLYSQLLISQKWYRKVSSYTKDNSLDYFPFYHFRLNSCYLKLLISQSKFSGT